MFPQSIISDITVYNLYEDLTGLQQLQPTVIKGVFWQANYGASLTAKGIVTADRVAVTILRETQVEGKTYIPPLDFKKLSADKKPLYWTLAKEDKFLNQIVTIPIAKVSELEKKFGYDNVLTITSALDNNFGSTYMRHFKIVGK